MERSDSAESLGIGVSGAPVGGVHAPPSLEIGDSSFDNIAYLVDRGVELFLPFEQFSSGRFAEGSRDSRSYVTFVADGVILAENVREFSIVDSLRIVSLTGKWIGDMFEVTGEVADELVTMAGGLVLAGEAVQENWPMTSTDTGIRPRLRLGL